MAVDAPPQDVPWRRLAVGADLTGVTDTTRPSSAITAGAAIQGLAPSIAVFQYVAPELSDSVPDSTPYPGSRVVLLRVPSSLTGIQVVTTTKVLGFTLTHRDYLPCIGAVLTLSIDSPDLKGQRKAPLYIRDSFPKRQEMVLNEVLGTQTMEREVERHSVTENWNVSGGFNVKAFTVGGGASQTEVTESEHERSTSDSHVINVSHVHHVLTSYHLGSRIATLTIQPRPYEGENWELLAGPRRVEGIQDFTVIANVPAGVKKLNVEACLTIGFLGYVSGGRLPPKPLDPLQIADAFEAAGTDVMSDLVAKLLGDAAEKIETWEKWIERYQRWLQIQEFVARINTTARVVMARLCASGTIDLKNPNRDVTIGRLKPPRFLDVALGDYVPVALTTPDAATSARSVANYFADRSFDAVVQMSSAAGSRFGETEFFRLKQWQQLTDLPRDHPLLDTAIEELGPIAEPDRGLLEASGAQTLRDLVAPEQVTDSPSEGEVLRALGPRMFASSARSEQEQAG